jgi:hypothetical protein
MFLRFNEEKNQDDPDHIKYLGSCFFRTSNFEVSVVYVSAHPKDALEHNSFGKLVLKIATPDHPEKYRIMLGLDQSRSK